MLLTPDMRLIHAVLQGGVKAFYIARNIGVRSNILFDEAKLIWDLMESMISQNRLPSINDIHTRTGVLIVNICAEAIDVTLISQLIVKRGLSSQLNKELGAITRNDAINSDPFSVRDKLIDLAKTTGWSYGSYHGLNNSSSMDELLDSYMLAERSSGHILGLTSPWPTVDSASLGLQPGELTVLFAKRKMGKCIDGNTVIYDSRSGKPTTIASLFNSKLGYIYSFDNESITSTAPVNYIDAGVKDCITVTYHSGRQITVTPDHHMLTPSGFRKASELASGEHTAGAGFIPEPSEAVTIERSELLLCAYLFARGKVLNRKLVFCISDSTIIDEIKSVLAVHNATLLLKQSDECEVALNTAARYDFTKAIAKKYNLCNDDRDDKEIPQDILTLDNKCLSIFLGRLLSCAAGIDSSGAVTYSTVSQKLALQLQHLLLRFRIHSRVRKLDRDRVCYYELIIYKHCVTNLKSLDLIGELSSKLSNLSPSFSNKLGWVKRHEVEQLIYEEISEAPDLLKLVGEKLNYKFKLQKSHFFDKKSDRLRRNIFDAFCSVYNSKLSWIGSPDIVWDEIAEITPVGPRHCYDLSVATTNCYLANDLIVHNSWITIAWALHVWKSDLKPGEKLLFVTMEMTPLAVLRRMACIDLKFDYELFRAGKLTKPEKEQLEKWVEARKNATDTDPNLVIVGSDKVRTISDLSIVTSEVKPRAIFVDSFYIMGRAMKQSIYDRMITVVQGLKLDVASEFKIPVFASTQLSGTTNKDVLTADSDNAMGAKAIGDYADATRGLFADSELRRNKQRIFRGMEAREFASKDVLINFDLNRMDFSEIREIDPDSESDGDDDDGNDNDDNGNDTSSKTPKKPSSLNRQSTKKQNNDELLDSSNNEDDDLYI